MEQVAEKIDNTRLGAIRAQFEDMLPSGWALTTLGEAFKWCSGGTPLRTNPRYYGGDIPWLIIGDLNDGVVTDAATHITEEGLANSATRWVEPGSVMLAMYGSIGKLGIAGIRLTTNQAIAFTDPHPHEGKYLFYYLMYSREALASLGKGATQKNISQAVIKEFPFPLPPLPQQRRIVEAIELQLGRLDAAVARLQGAKARLKRYKQAVLKAAVDEANDEAGGNVVRLDEVADLCLGKMLDRQKNKGTPHPYLRNINVRWGTFDTEDLHQMPFEDHEHERYGLEEGDLVVCEGGEPGRCAVWDGSIPDMKIQKALHRVRCSSKTDPHWVMYSLLFSCWSGSIAKYYTGTTIKHLTGKSLSSFELVHPSIKTQRRLVARVQEAFDRTDEMDSTLDAQFQQAVRLRQAVLKRAFEGKLVAADVPVIKLPTPISIAAEPPAPYERTAFHRVLNIEERAALNAWVVHVSNKDHTLGRTKAEKIEHMIEGHVGYDHQREPLRDAAGPIDLMSRLRVEETMTKMKWAWVEEKELRGGKRMFLYHSGPSVSSAVRCVEDLLGERLSEAERIVKAMRPLKTARAEVVATLYAAWNDLLHRSKPVTDRDIMIEATTEWHEDKMEVEYSEWVWGLRWLREHGLTPTGNAKLVKAKPKK